MLRLHFLRTVAFAILGTIIAFVIYWLTPPIYEARSEVLLGEPPARGASLMTQDVEAILNRGAAQTADTEVLIIRSPQIFFEALQKALASLQRNEAEAALLFEDLYRKFDVIDLGRQRNNQAQITALAQLRVRASDPRLAEAICTQLVFSYNDNRLRLGRRNVQQAIAYLEGQLAQTEAELNRAEADFQRYKEEIGVIDFGLEAQRITLREDELKKTIAAYEAQIQGNQSQLNTVLARLANQPERVTDMESEGRNPVIGQIEAALTDAKRQREILLVTYLPDAIPVKSIETSIRDLEERLREAKAKQFEDAGRTTTANPLRRELERQKEALMISLAGLRSSLRKEQSELDRVLAEKRTLPAKEIKLIDLTRRRQIFNDKFLRLKVQAEELRNRAETTATTAQVISNPRLLDDPVAPNLPKLFLICFIAGSCTGLLLSFAIESMKLRVHNSAQLSELTGLPVVAAVPALGKGKPRQFLQSLSTGERKPHESFRYMAYALNARGDVDKKRLLFTAIGLAPGRTGSVLQFAVALANTGVKVLLVDADPARASLTQSLGHENKAGFSDLLKKSMLPGGDQTPILSTGIENLSFLPAGSGMKSSLSDLPADNVSDVLAFLDAQADVVVFDTAPCDLFSDAALLAPYVSEVYLVISAARTNYRAIPVAYDLLVRAGAPSVSLVLTDASQAAEPFGRKNLYFSSS